MSNIDPVESGRPVVGEDHPLVFAAETDVGMVREENQDFYQILSNDQGSLFVLADAVGGGAPAGEVSRVAVEAFISRCRESAWDDPPALLAEALAFAHFAVIDAAADDPSLSGVGATLDGLMIKDDLAHFIHVGDSRIYRYHHGEFALLTVDRAGSAGEGSNSAVEDRFKMVGGAQEPEPMASAEPAPVAVGDYFLLCTDGLTDQVAEAEIVEALELGDPESIAIELVELANERGGYDNVTAIVVRKGEPPVRITGPADAAGEEVSDVEMSESRSAPFQPIVPLETDDDEEGPLPARARTGRLDAALGPIADAIDAVLQRPLIIAAGLIVAFLLGVAIAAFSGRETSKPAAVPTVVAPVAGSTAGNK